MDENEFEDYDRDAELALYREYRDVVKMFRYVIETERRFYLANEVDVKRIDAEHDFYFELTMNDVWVWDVYRADRFVKSVRVLTFKDVNVEVQDKDGKSTLNLYRDALRIRRDLLCAEEFKWVKHLFAPEVLHFVRPNGWQCVTNFGTKPFKLPKGQVLLTTKEIVDGKLPANATAWII